MRQLLSTLLVGTTILCFAPSLAHAATPYFETGGTTSFDFVVGQSGGVDISLVHRGPATWVVVGGRLPNGVSIVNHGGTSARSIASITGMASEEGVFPVRIMAMVDSVPYFLGYSVNAYNANLVVNPIGVAQGRVGLPYSQPLTVGGSTLLHPTFVWSIDSGTIPPGLTLNGTTGIVSGTPTLAGTYRYVVRVYEAGGFNRVANLREYVHTIQPAEVIPVRITTRTNPVSGRVGNTYSPQIFQATGGGGAYRWAVTSGSLPPGLTLNGTTGIIQGTPTMAGTYTASIKAYDSVIDTNSDAFTFSIVITAAVTPLTSPPLTPVGPISPTIPVAPTALTLVSTSVPGATVGTAYSATLVASGGTAPYSWNFASGALPTGVNLSANGVVSGVPTTIGTYVANIEVFDATGAFVGRVLTFTVGSAGSMTAPVTPPPSTPAASPELTNRLQNLARIGVSVHAVVKLPNDGNPMTQEDSAVYYIGTDGRRHAFPNDRVFFSWYSNFDEVRVVSQADLATIPLGSNVTYRPGSRMVKFTTDPKVYAIAGNRTLRWVKTEAAAIAIYGANWNRQIDDIADTFYTDYLFGAEINVAADFDQASLLTTYRYVSDNLSL